MNYTCLIQYKYLYGKDMRIQRYGIKFVTLTTPTAIAVSHRIAMATNPTTSVILTGVVACLLFYFICIYFSQSLELSRSNHAQRTHSCPFVELCLGEKETESKARAIFLCVCLLHSGPVFLYITWHQSWQQLCCCVFRSPNFPLEYLGVSEISPRSSSLNTQFP